MRIDKIIVGSMQVNCYIVSSEKTSNALLIDPGDDFKRIHKFLENTKLNPCFIVHTHGHIDHIGTDNEFKLPVYAHRLEAELLKQPDKNLSSFLTKPFKVSGDINLLEDSQEITLDDIALKVLHTPGHTPGGICLDAGGIVFTGDTLFSGSVGRTDFSGASHEQLIKSIHDKLMGFADNTVIYPGHGPASTIGKEKRNNPFLT